MMGNSSRDKFSVFDFNEDDERVESESRRFFGKAGNSQDNSSDSMKYDFIRAFARGDKETKSTSYVDLDSSDSKYNRNSSGFCDLSLSEGESATKERILGLDAVLISKSVCHEPNVNMSTTLFESGSLFSERNSPATRALIPSMHPAENKELSCSFLDPSSDSDVGLISDDNESTRGSSPSTSSDLRENEGEPASGYCQSNWVMDNTSMEVAVSPDFVRYGDGYSTEAFVVFSCSYIKLDCLTTCGNKESCSFEWAIDDVIKIESRWCEMSGTALVKLLLKEADGPRAENAGYISGVVELTFGISDSQWSEKQQLIQQLHARYLAIWNLVHGTEEADCWGQNTIGAFEDVIYPKGDPDAVSISKRDVELLQPETFINDTIIDFYIKYLKNKIKPEDKHRFHFFNSFFFRKLADLDKDPSSASEGRAAFLRVRKWTRRVDLFEKDYIFIPINFNLHWSLIVICHPGEVVNFKDEVIEKSPKIPCILHMDSIKGSHKGLKNLIQSYLWEEWKEKKKESSEDISVKFSNLRFVPLELPQQENSFDCGLFLLHYVELFLEEAPVDFSPFKITKFSHFLNMNWFPPSEPSCKRKLIKKLIYEILEEYSPKVPQPASGDKQSSSEHREDNYENETGVEILSEELNLRKMCQNNSSSTADQGIEIKLLPRSSTEILEGSRDTGLICREFFTPGATAALSPDGHCRTFDTMTSYRKLKFGMSPIEEDSESCEQFEFSPSADRQPLAALTKEDCETSSHSSEECERFEMLLDPKVSMDLEERCDGETYHSPSDCGSPSSPGGPDEHDLMKDVASPNCQYPQKLSQASPQNVGCITECPDSPDKVNLERHIVEDSLEVDDENSESHIVEDSPEMNRLANSNEPDGPLCSLPENSTSSHREVDVTRDVDIEGNDVELSGDSLSESFREPFKKRPRLTS